jgi:Domain of unknown function (DUF4157)
MGADPRSSLGAHRGERREMAESIGTLLQPIPRRQWSSVKIDGPAEQDRSSSPVRRSIEPGKSLAEPSSEPPTAGFVVAGLAVPHGSADPTKLVHRSVLVGAADDPAEIEAERTAESVVAALRRSAACRTSVGQSNEDQSDPAGSAGPAARHAERDGAAAGRRSTVTALRRIATTGAGGATTGAGGATTGAGGTPAGTADHASQRSGADRIGAAGGAVDADTGARIAALRGTGAPLSPGIRRSMEAALRTDLSDVRVHSGPAAADLTDRLGAEAFTVGSHIAFRDGLPDLGAEPGQRLLAHELTHVVQNRGAAVRPAPQSPAPGDEPAPARRAPRLAAAAKPVVRRVLRFENGEEANAEALIASHPDQEDEILAKHLDAAVWVPVKSAAGLQFRRLGAAPVTRDDAPADDGLEEWERLALDVGPSSVPASGPKPAPALDPASAPAPSLDPAGTPAPAPVPASAPTSSPALSSAVGLAAQSPAVSASMAGPSSGARMTLRQFSDRYAINKALPYLKPLGDPVVLPGKPSKIGSAIAYVANVLTVPRAGGVQAIIDSYTEQAVSAELMGSFAMVIGVNRYRSLAGGTPESVRAATTGAASVFPCTIVPFVWDFNWTAPFEDVQAAYQRLAPEDRATVLAQEKENLNQSVIPYGSLREFVTAHPATRAYVAALHKGHKAVYVHLGDDDAASLTPRGGGKLLGGYSRRIQAEAASSSGKLPRLVVGGYEFRLSSDLGGDLDPGQPGAVLTSIASRLDMWFRAVLSMEKPDRVYPTEPNLAFLAAADKHNHLDLMLTPSLQQERELATERRRTPGDGVQSAGLLYGRNANEGNRLRERIMEITPSLQSKAELLKAKAAAAKGGGSKGGGSKGAKAAAASAERVTVFDPSLAIATASTRFTLHDGDRRQHEPSQAVYRERRAAALAADASRAAWQAQIVEDLLTIKQSHVGLLAKELAGEKDAAKIAADVKAYLAAILLGKDPPAASSKFSVPYLAAMHKARRELTGPIKDLQAFFAREAAASAPSAPASAAVASPAPAEPGAGVASSVQPAPVLVASAAVGRPADVASPHAENS